LLASDYISRQQLEQLDDDDENRDSVEVKSRQKLQVPEATSPTDNVAVKNRQKLQVLEATSPTDKDVDAGEDSENQSVELIKKMLTKLLGERLPSSLLATLPH
jgi:hypothetical protein